MSGVKILITGNSGSGKSTLSKLIESKRQIPRYSLDCIVWQSDWRKKTPDQEKNEKIDIILNSNSWVIDAVSIQVFTAAERIYFLEYSPVAMGKSRLVSTTKILMLMRKILCLH